MPEGASRPLGALALLAGFTVVSCGASEPREGSAVAEVESDLTAAELACEGYDSAAANRMAAAGAKRDGQRSQKRCYSYVKKHLEGAGYAVPGEVASGGRYAGSAYMFTTWARKNPEALRRLGFAEVKLKLGEAPPKGAIIVWGRGECGYSKSHGHIEVVIDDGGRACSDFCGRVKTARKCGTPDVFIPVRASGDPGAGCSKDSCAGRADGWYCSEIKDFSAFNCKGQNISGGYQCATGKKCVFSGSSRAATLQGTVPQCR